MEITATPAASLAETIKNETKSPSTTTTLTLKLLRALLGLDDPVPPASNPTLKKSHASAPTTTADNRFATRISSKRAKPVKSQVPAKVAIYTIPETSTSLSTNAQKLALATDVFNKTLKSLSNAARSRKTAEAAPNNTACPTLSPPRLNRPDDGRPLHEASPNRQYKPPSIPKSKETLTANSSLSAPGLVTTAECARTTLDCLRGLEKTNGRAEDLQLERGSLILLENLNTLKLSDLAIQEIHILRTRLDHKIQISSGPSTTSQEVIKGAPSHRIDAMVQVLRFDTMPTSEALCNLVVSFQKEVLKTIAFAGPNAIAEPLVEALQLRCKNGPYAIIFQSYNSNLLSAEKATRHLQTLAQTMSLLCSSAGPTGDQAAAVVPSPGMIFQLQLAALEIQCSSWTFTKAQPDLGRIVWAPFIRVVKRFCQISGVSKKEQYVYVRNGLQSLKSTLKATPTDALVNEDTEIPVVVTDYLATLAQECGYHADSIDFLHCSLQASDDIQSLASIICRCKIATLHLQAFSDNPSVAVRAVEDILTSLKGSLKGSARDLEDMLLHGVRLRKAALDTLWKLEKSAAITPLVDIQVKLRCCSIKAVFAILNFVSRYVGRPPDSTSSSPEQMGCFHKKVRLARSIAEMTINNTLTAARSAVDNSATTWAETDSAINECLVLAKILDRALEQSTEPDMSQNTSSMYLKMSNIYWLQFLKSRESTSNPTESLELLKKSTRILDDRPEPERRIGLLAAKYEKMASIYMDSQEFEKAKETLCGAIAIHVSSLPFQVAIRTGSLFPMRCTRDGESSAIFAFGKTLTTFVRLQVSSHEVKQKSLRFYDDEKLSTDERLALLERQAAIYMAISPATSKLASIAPLVQLILSLYSPCQSLRQVGFLLSILKYSSRLHDDQLEGLLEERLSNGKLDGLENDLRSQPSLSSCGIPLFTSLRLQLAFKKGRPSTQLLHDMVEGWSALVSDKPDWQALECHLDEPSSLLGQVQAIVDFTDMQGLNKLRLSALHLQQKMLESQKQQNHATHAVALVRKGLQCSRLGFTADAGRVLASAKKCIDSLDSQPAVCLEYYLALAEHLLNISDLEGCVQALEVAHSQYTAAFNTKVENEDQRLGLSQARFLCQSASLTSRWQFERGNLSKAVFHAKQCVRLSSQMWAGVQRMQAPIQLHTAIDTNDSTLDSLVGDFSNMNISNNDLKERLATRGAPFWPYVSIHCEALMSLSYLLASCGLYQDGIYYADQAQRIAQAVDSPLYVFAAGTLLLAHRRKANDVNASVEASHTRRLPLEAEYDSLGAVLSSVYLAEASISAGDMSAASEAIDEATQCLSRIDLGHKSIPATLETGKPPAGSVVPILASAKLKTRTKTHKAVQAKSMRPREKDRPTSSIKGNAKTEDTRSTTSVRLETTIDVLKAHIMLNSGKGEDAVSLLARSKDIRIPGPELVRSRLIQARTILDEIFKNLSADAVHCVLAETTIAFPALQKERTSGRQVILESPVATKTLSSARTPVLANSRKPMHHDTESRQAPDSAMRAAELLLEALVQRLGSCPTDMLRELSVMLNQCFMLSSVLLRQRHYTPVQVALQAAVPNCSAMARESSVITTDVTLTSTSNLSSWPVMVHDDQTTAPMATADAFPIQPGCLDKLPEQWNIVSMQLSRTRDELSITKFHVGQPPFSLRIPLRRCSSDEVDEVDFGFAAAKAELLNIIESANKTAHDSSGQSDKQAKKSWWTEREALDDRLKVLLENIENIWLGGFRGILAHQHRHQDLLSRFSGSLLRSLNQHLPSRQKSHKTTGADSHLHAHVLDLFVALGHPNERDLEDSIADLLYFVVDILQFQGEHNAYDEIDFDIITVEVLDALRCYHEKLRALDVEHTQHTVLILDKELLAFPWESLPCLDGRPVSRMPSLNCVESRLDQMRLQDADASALSISTGNGAYILNPSSDLTSTQSTFAAAFSASLPHFSSIVDRVPTEAEFELYLREKELFLYFGHGSGAQYIRGRNIKRLERCAVSFLMGCSSGKMVECGEFEPHGVPWHYMHASAPAVVGTLWDVTDKDIDRFAMKTFAEWGLLGEEAAADEAAGTKTKRRGKNGKGKGKGGKQPTRSAPKQRVALDEAVATARNACVLRYLNGAAPVIYGIPVVLG